MIAVETQRIVRWAGRALWVLVLVALLRGALQPAAGAAAPDSQPDLTVEISITPPVPAVGQEATINLVVRNQGAFDATGSFALEVYVDPTTRPPSSGMSGYPSYSVPGLAAGATFGTDFTQSFATQGCDHIVYTWVDRTNAIGESNEGNNLVALPVCVGVTCPVDGYEEDNLCEQARWLTDSAQAHSFCHATDKNLPDPDWVKFTAFAGVTYTVAATNAGLHAAPQVTLYEACGAVPKAGPGRQVSVRPSSGQLYFAKVENAGTISGPLTTYSLTLTSATGVTDDYEPDNTCATARDIVPGGQPQRHRFQAPGDEDWVRFPIQAGQSFIVLGTGRGSGVDPQVALFSSCAQAALEDTVQSAGQQVQTSSATDQVYYARVRNANSAIFGVDALYDLAVTASACQADGLEDDDSAAQARNLAVGGAAQSRTSCPASDEDWGKFSASAGKIYVIQTSNLGADGDTELVLYDQNGATELIRNDDFGYGRASRIVWQAPGAGVYFVRVRHHNPTASGAGTQYDLAVLEGFCVPDAAEAGTADNGPGDAAVLGAGAAPQPHNFCADPLRTDLGDQDWLRFAAVAGGSYQIRTEALGANADTVLELMGGDGATVLQKSDDFGRGLSANLHYTATVPGTYFVRATQFNSTLNGYGTNYQIKLLANEPPPPPPPPTPTPPPPVVTPTPEPSAVQTIILVNRARLAAVYGAAQADQVMGRLYNLAGHAKVQGVVVQVEKDGAVAAAYGAWTTDAAALRDAGKANSVVGAIRGLLMAFIGNKPNVRHVIIVGADRIIPFRRVPDRVAPQGPSSTSVEPKYAGAVVEDGSVRAALAANMVLTDDYLVDQEFSTWQDFHKNKYDLYIPDYATARLVETPAEITAFIDNFLAGDTTITPNKVLITGYDFAQDSAAIIRNRFSADQITPDAGLIGAQWSGDQLRARYLAAAPRFDVYSANGHSTHLAAGVPDTKNITAAEVAGATTDLSGALVYSLGCHGGLNEPGVLDLPQAFAQKRANYVGNTGFGWGGSGQVYSEALMRNYTVELVRGARASIGPALAAAKRKYYSQSKTAFDAFDAKVMMQTTLYGLPMVEMTSGGTFTGEEPFPSAEGSFTPPSGLGGLAQGTVGYRLPGSFGAFGDQSSAQGRTFDLDGNVEFRAGEPVQPQYFADVSAPTVGALHGVIFLGGVYTEVTGFNPVVALAENEYVVDKSEPAFSATGFYPAAPFAFHPSMAVPGAADTVVMSLGQYQGGTGGQGVARIYDRMALGVFYSNSPDQNPAAVTFVDGVLDAQAGKGHIKVEAADGSGVGRVVVAFTNGQGLWQSQDLGFAPATQKWTGTITGTMGTEYFVQVVDAAGNVAIADNKGSYYRLAVPLPLAAGRPVVMEQRIFLPAVRR